MKKLRSVGLPLALVLFLFFPILSHAQNINVTTYHNDNMRTGQNLKETFLTPQNVNTNTFGRLFSRELDGEVYGQPLYMSNVVIPGKGRRNVVFVATQHDSVYAWDADSNLGDDALPLWYTSFIDPSLNITAVPTSDMAQDLLMPEIGITSTPVIDEANGTIFVVAKTKEMDENGAHYYQRIHALDISTGNEKFGGPVTINATVPGTGDGADSDGFLRFNAFRHHQRAALLLSKGMVYITWASLGDIEPFHGWVMAYNATNLTQEAALNLTAYGEEGGIWQSGAGLAADAAGSVYGVAGNGTSDYGKGPNFGNSAVRMGFTNGVFQVLDFFTPYNTESLTVQDLDLGSGGPLLLPDQSGPYKHLMVFGSKAGTFYVVNRDNMGGFNPDDNSQIIQSIEGTVGAAFGVAAYYGGRVYFNGASDVLKVFNVVNDQLILDATNKASVVYRYPPGTPSISANGNTNGLVWILQNEGFSQLKPAILRVYDANNLTRELYNSSKAPGRDTAGIAVRFTVPTVVNGKVFVPGRNQLTVYGLTTFVPPPVITPDPGLFVGSLTITVSNPLTNSVVHYTLDGSDPTESSPIYIRPFILDHSAAVKVRGFSTNYGPSQVVMNTFLEHSALGAGGGLTGDYYSHQDRTFTGRPTVSRVDGAINFNWPNGLPAPEIYPGTFTTRWHGSIEPIFSEPHTFFIRSTGGVRLWVNGKRIIDSWGGIPFGEVEGTVSMEGGALYDVRLESWQSSFPTSISLFWSSPSQAKAPVPTSQLFASTSPARDFVVRFPQGASSFSAPAYVVIGIEAPPWKLERVEYYNGATKIGESSSDPFTIEWTGVHAGSYSITARTYDSTSIDQVSPAAILTVAAPFLRIEPSAKKVLLAWSAAGGKCILESSVSPSPLATWRTVSQTPVVTDGENQVTLNATDAVRFYRLRTP